MDRNEQYISHRNSDENIKMAGREKHIGEHTQIKICVILRIGNIMQNQGEMSQFCCSCTCWVAEHYMQLLYWILNDVVFL